MLRVRGLSCRSTSAGSICSRNCSPNDSHQPPRACGAEDVHDLEKVAADYNGKPSMLLNTCSSFERRTQPVEASVAPVYSVGVRRSDGGLQKSPQAADVVGGGGEGEDPGDQRPGTASIITSLASRSPYPSAGVTAVFTIKPDRGLAGRTA